MTILDSYKIISPKTTKEPTTKPSARSIWKPRKSQKNWNWTTELSNIPNLRPFTLKDHKENFDNDPKCRLINPAKSNIGKISKQILQKANKQIRTQLNLKQWQSTDQVL